MRLVNLTPHDIVLRDTQGNDTVVPATGQLARVESIPGQPETVAGIPVLVYSASSFGAVSGLPEPAEDTIYIVSMIVASALIGKRTDLVYPGTGPNDHCVRDEHGRIQAVTRLIRA